MNALRYTLLSDGGSDQALLPILNWVLENHLNEIAVQEQWADLRDLPHPPTGLSDKIRRSLDLYPCDLLFVHRDAENQSPELRYTEIDRALTQVAPPIPTLCVVPIRMQEAWLLLDERAIRHAANNPNGDQRLSLPPSTKLEELPDPKDVLHRLLREASDLHGRRLDQFRPTAVAYRVTDFMDDFSVLRQLSAFRRLEADVQQLIAEQHWN